MKGPAGEDGGDAIAEINIIPLVDVVLVLLIIFMVTTVFAQDKAIELTLPPGSRNATAAKPAEITVSITRDGKMNVNGKPTKQEDLQNAIKGVMRINTDNNQKSVLIVRGDKDVIYGKITPILQEISYTGVSITLAIQDPK